MSGTERERLAALARYDILDTPRERDFDEVAELAAAICQTPIAVVNLIGEGRQFFKAEVGLGVRETPLDSSFCARAILEEEFLLVPDAARDPRFACNPLVTGEPHLRFYAGALLRTDDGHAIGTVCVLDHRPRDLTDVQQRTLRVLARQVMTQIALRLAVRERASDEARQRRVLESAVDYAIIATDPAGLVTSWNRGAELILGWSQDEMLGRSAEIIFTPEDRDADVPAREMRQARERGRGNDERWHQRRDGSRFFASGEMMPLTDEAEVQVGYLKILRDRTDQREAGQALAASEARYRALFEAVDDGFCIIEFVDGPDGPMSDYVHVEANPGYERQTGIAGIVGRTLRGLAPDEAEGWLALYGDVLRTGRPIRFERDFAAAGRHIEVSAARIEPASRRQVSVMFRDVSARKQAEAALRASEAVARGLNDTLEQRVAERTDELNHLWNTSPDLLLIIDRDGVFRRVNPAWTAVLGYREDELVGRHVDAFALPGDGTAGAGLRAAEGGTPRTVERYRHKDGSARCISWVAARHGEATYATGRDVTAEQEQAAALHQAEEALRQSQKMEAVGQLTGGLAHDFNNLLAGVSGSLELMATRLSQGRMADVERYIATAQGAAKRAAALTHRLLAFSRRQTLDPKPTDVNRLVAGMQDLVQRTVGPAIAVEVVGAAGLWPTLVDPSQLENALLNLCINARDAMPDGGRITIETANRWLDDRAARQHDMPEGQYLSVCVTDTGTGMTPDVIAKAFDPFFTTKPIGQGTGLGLSMIYGFAKQSGGQVRLYSEVGDGTTVCLYLPRHYGAVADEDGAARLAALPRSEQGATVLVVDDEPTVRMLVTDVLEELGYTAIEAADSAAGLRVLRSDVRLDLLVTDVGLPGGMNGRQMADAGRERRADLKVLFITGYAENAAIGNGHLEPGMQVLTKPFAIETLAARIRELIAR